MIPCKMEELITEPQFEATSSQIVAGNEDLAAEIFIRLPPTSLGRFIWVSKQWLSFISNPTFIQRHALLNPPSLSGLFLIPRQTSQIPEIQFVSLDQCKPNLPIIPYLNSQGFQILHSCNGLLLCCSGLSHYVCNPTTRRFRVLPSCPCVENKSGLNLAFDPLTSPNYKVVCVNKLDGQEAVYQIAIYSSETRLWSLTNVSLLAPNDIDFKGGVFCNGAIHWLSRTSSGVYLDLKTQMLSEMPQLPRREEESQYHFKYFGKSQGCLFYVVSRPLLNYYELFQMKEDYTGWDLKFRFNLNVLVPTFPAMARNFGLDPLFSEYECDVLCINRLGSDEDIEIVLSVPGEVVIYNIHKKTSIKIRDPLLRLGDVTLWKCLSWRVDDHDMHDLRANAPKSSTFSKILLAKQRKRIGQILLSDGNQESHA